MLILVDPPAEHFIDEYRECFRGRYINTPYQGGYIDFTPWSLKGRIQAARTLSSPPRTSARDDLQYYYTQFLSEGPLIEKLTIETVSTIFLKFIVSHVVAHIEYMKSITNEIEVNLANPGMKGDVAYLETQLRELFGWNRRISTYCEEIDSMLDTLKISRDGSNPRSVQTGILGDWQDDVLYIQRRATYIKARINELIATTNGMIGIMQAMQSLRVSMTSENVARQSLFEAQSVKMLTILATTFLPLAYIASIFSMGGSYAPGQSKFWVYWAVAAPFAVAIVVGAAVMGGFRNPRG